MEDHEAENRELLRRSPIFALLEPETLAQVASRCRRRRFRARATLVHEGEPGHTLYVILSGRVRVEAAGPAGKPVQLAERGPGETVGELSLLDGKPAMATVITAEPTELLLLGRDDFLQCLRESPAVAIAVLACLADRLREAGAHLGTQQSLDVLGRVCRTLVTHAEAHGEPHPDGGTRLSTVLSQQRLADQLGTTRESVNRVFRRLRQVGAIQLDGRRIIVTDPDKLRRYASR